MLTILQFGCTLKLCVVKHAKALTTLEKVVRLDVCLSFLKSLVVFTTRYI